MTDGIIQEVFKKYTSIGMKEDIVWFIDMIEKELIEKIKQEFAVQLPYIGYNVSDDIDILKFRLIGDNK